MKQSFFSGQMLFTLDIVRSSDTGCFHTNPFRHRREQEKKRNYRQTTVKWRTIRWNYCLDFSSIEEFHFQHERKYVVNVFRMRGNVDNKREYCRTAKAITLAEGWMRWNRNEVKKKPAAVWRKGWTSSISNSAFCGFSLPLYLSFIFVPNRQDVRR